VFAVENSEGTVAKRRFGVSTHLYHGEALRREHLLEIAANGFETVEVFATRSHLNYHDPRCVEALSAWLAESRLELHSVHAPIMDSLVNNTWGRAYSTAIRDESTRQTTIREIEAALSIASVVPFKFLVVHLGLPASQMPGTDDNRRDAAIRSIENIHQLAEPLGVRVALEVMPNDLSTASALVDLIENHVDFPDLGICMDVGHAFILGDPAEAIETASGHLVTTHIHDNRRQQDDHVVPFEGGIDWASTMMAMEKIGYDGVSMFEVRNTDSSAAVLARARSARKRLEGLISA
jgi:sugar phosphate isomerase/epimerase